MQNIFIDILPPWVETGLQPAFYDLESGTVLQQTARMYAKVRELTEAFNTFTENVTNEVNTFENSVNETVEEYIEKFNQLHDYVEDYFENLDVQQEINNKLDDMVEDGTLQEIITTYIQSNVAWTFDTVADMQNATNLVSGSFAQTLGFHTLNDGGSTIYKIREKEVGESADGIFKIAIGDDLIADIVIVKEINVNACGAYGDNTHDDYATLTAICTYALNHNYKLSFCSNSTYLLSAPLDVSNLFVDFNNCTLKVYGESSIDSLIKVDSEEYYTTIENVNIDATNADNGINLVQARKCYVTNVNIININGTGIRQTGGYECKVTHINLTGDGTSQCYGLYIYGHDGTYSDVVMIDCYTGIYNHGFNFYNDVHAWIYSETLYYHSCFMNIELNPVICSNMYSDTYHWVICSESDIAECVINGMYVLTSERVLTIEDLQGEPISLHHGKSASYNARYINIKDAIIQAPSFGINWNTNNSNTAIDFDGVIEARFPSAKDKYLQGIPNSPALTLPNTLQKTTETVNITMDTVNLNLFYKILTVAGSYSITLPFFTEATRLPVYQCTQWDKSELVGLAYFNNNTCSISIAGDATLTQNRYLHIGGTLPRIYRSLS